MLTNVSTTYGRTAAARQGKLEGREGPSQHPRRLVTMDMLPPQVASYSTPPATQRNRRRGSHTVLYVLLLHISISARTAGKTRRHCITCHAPPARPHTQAGPSTRAGDRGRTPESDRDLRTRRGWWTTRRRVTRRGPAQRVYVRAIRPRFRSRPRRRSACARSRPHVVLDRSDCDPRAASTYVHEGQAELSTFARGHRTSRGFHRVSPGVVRATSGALASEGGVGAAWRYSQ
ncbi:hypothetical protein C8Q77DRAFT_224097 [Trametes polyzona]|nr:hypothetical protein C8Q77DRAFT_224097 [Trametes polyzona]